MFTIKLSEHSALFMEFKKNISHPFTWTLFDAKNKKPFSALTIMKNNPSIRSKLYAEIDLRVVEAIKIAPSLSNTPLGHRSNSQCGLLVEPMTTPSFFGIRCGRENEHN